MSGKPDAFSRSLAIDELSYGPGHPVVARDLNDLAELLRATNRLSEAEPTCRRAVRIMTDSYGPDHPSTQTVRENLDALLWQMGKELDGGGASE